MKKWLIYFIIENKSKHLQYTNFSNEAEIYQDAIKNLSKIADFKHRVIGIREYKGEGFENNKLQ